MIYRIYYLKNKENKVVYVGQTRRDLETRLRDHRKKFPNRKDYTIHLIAETNDKNIANELETFNIKRFDTVNNGENITYGKGTKGLGVNKTSFKKVIIIAKKWVLKKLNVLKLTLFMIV